MRDQLTTAIQQRKIVTFTYQGHTRRVQPAAYGKGHRKGKETLHAYQIGGESRRGGIPHWRNFHVDQIQSLTVLDEVFGPNPPGYSATALPEVYVALPPSPTAGAGAAGGPPVDAPAQADQVIPGVPISAEQAAKAAEAASKALGQLGKWFRKR